MATEGQSKFNKHHASVMKSGKYLVASGDKKTDGSVRSIGGAEKLWKEHPDWVYDLANHLVGPKGEVQAAVKQLDGARKSAFYTHSDFTERRGEHALYESKKRDYAALKGQGADTVWTLDELVTFYVNKKADQPGVKIEVVKSEHKSSHKKTAEEKRESKEKRIAKFYKRELESGKVFDLTHMKDDGAGARYHERKEGAKPRKGTYLHDGVLFNSLSQVRKFAKHRFDTDAQAAAFVAGADAEMKHATAAAAPKEPRKVVSLVSPRTGTTTNL
jgi:ribosomal protein S12